MIEITRLEAPTSLARTEPSTRTPLRVGVVQHRWHADEAVLHAELNEGIERAAKLGASVVFLPELTLSRYPADTRPENNPAAGIRPSDITEDLLTGPTFTFAATGTLAVGLGPTLVVASLLYQVVLSPLPFNDPDQLVRFWHARLERNQTRVPLSIPDYMDFRARQDVFEAFAAHTGTSVAMRPTTVPTTSRRTPPHSISIAVATSGLLGSRSRRESTDPEAQHTAATSRTRAPAGSTEPPPFPPVLMSNAVPPNPRASPATVPSRTRSRSSSQAARTIHAGMVAIISAVTPIGTRCSAHDTPPLPTNKRSPPTASAASHWGRPIGSPSRSPRGAATR